MTLLRRLLVIIALMFWQGGFTFYAAVVVPIGQNVLQSHIRQGLITREVAYYINLSGVIALLVLAWDAAVSHDPGVLRRRWRWFSWCAMVVALGLLFWLYPRLDELFDTLNVDILDRKTFRREHRWYLWISTLQWGFAILYAALTLWSWREEDRRLQGLTDLLKKVVHD
jgi:hypothetical protein